MAPVTCKATVVKEGLVALPKRVQRELDLREADTVEITVYKREPLEHEREDNPLYGLIGLGKGGPPDGAENHDQYLYGRRRS
ncbi:MAG: hypothetical protein HY318_14545 [Armatimonadetes bacterium]|nr:hypothetical protein [Armatimonadota bacterium]